MARPAKSKASTTQLLLVWQRFQSADLTTNLLNDLHWLLCATGTNSAAPEFVKKWTHNMDYAELQCEIRHVWQRGYKT